MTRIRTENGQFATEYTEGEVLEAFDDASVPLLTSSEVAEFVGCSPGTAREKLESLVDDGELLRKEVGARAVVYVRLDQGGYRLSGYGEWKRALGEYTDGQRS